jgi:hypothetical protein
MPNGLTEALNLACLSSLPILVEKHEPNVSMESDKPI